MYKQLQNTFSADFLTVALYWNGKGEFLYYNLFNTYVTVLPSAGNTRKNGQQRRLTNFEASNIKQQILK